MRREKIWTTLYECGVEKYSVIDVKSLYEGSFPSYVGELGKLSFEGGGVGEALLRG